jgi:L-threonylcarbamoyladenylate synthase
VSYTTDSFDDKITTLLMAGGVGFVPTDTIYGLSARALDERAVEKVHQLKKRDSHKPLIALISDIKMLDLLSISANQAKLAEKYWPGQLSVILSALTTPLWLQLGTKTLAVRWPKHQDLISLIDKIGPIVSTSANLQGDPPVNSVAEAKQVFNNQLDFYVDVGELNNQPSTLAIIKNGKLEVVRQGAVKIDQ